MKKRFQKLTSMALVLVMLVTMIPAGIFTANAAEDGDVVTIMSRTQWDALDKTQTFEGKTVKLGAHISGITTPLVNDFKGTFDGANYTISDSNVAGAGVIADTISGDATVQNVKLSNVSVENANGHAGLVAGTVSATDAWLYFFRISATGCTVTGTGLIGGLFGYVNVTTSMGESTIDISNVYIQATVTATVEKMAAGGLIGSDASQGISATKTVTMNISDTVVYGNVTSKSNSCGLIGEYAGGNIANNNDNGEYGKATHTAYLNLTNVGVSGGSQFKVMHMAGGAVAISNLYLLDTNGNLFGAANYRAWINEVNMNAMGRNSVTADKMAAAGVETPVKITNIEKLPVMEGGFVKYVPEKIQVVGVQRSVAVDDTYALRFIAPIYLTDVYDVEMTIEAKYVVDGVEETRTFTSIAAMYDSLTAYSKYDITDKKIVYASDFGAHKLAGFTIYNIPVGFEVTYIATMTYTFNGQQITSKSAPIKFTATGDPVVDTKLPPLPTVGSVMGWNDVPEVNA
ncbi:MAG: hypothetical protein J6Q82_02750 [Clostridia bacterium]|nr:hypothetical protein [Clostridia bacterium]